MINRLLLAIIALLVIVSVTLPLLAEDLFINISKIEFDITPETIEKNTMVPLQQMQKNLQFRILKLSTTKTAIYYNRQYYVINLTDNKVQTNSDSYKLQPEPVVVNGYLLLPLSFFTEILGIEMDGNSDESEGDLKLTLNLEKYTLSPDEDIEARLILKNTGEKTRELEFNSSQKYDFILENEQGEIVKKWSEGKMFAQVITRLDLEPGATEYFEDEISIDNLQSGSYYLYGIIPAGEEITTRRTKIYLQK